MQLCMCEDSSQCGDKRLLHVPLNDHDDDDEEDNDNDNDDDNPPPSTTHLYWSRKNTSLEYIFLVIS